MANDRNTHEYDVFDAINGRWPKHGDRLLSSGRDVFLANSEAERSFRLLRGYKRAGDILIQNAMTDPHHRDSLIFPALFSYRHYIELALKATVEEHGNFAGVTLNSKNHKLPELWQLFVKIGAWFGCDDADVAAVGRCIEEFANIDARSTAFRYARNLKGDTPCLLSDGLDLENLCDVMNGIENFFECADLHFTSAAEMLQTQG
ncbi:MAG: hypothetical protein ABTQ30_17780 [Rhizobiaceae bacterium]